MTSLCDTIVALRLQQMRSKQYNGTVEFKSTDGEDDFTEVGLLRDNARPWEKPDQLRSRGTRGASG
jgi:hypothetical protein